MQSGLFGPLKSAPEQSVQTRCQETLEQTSYTDKLAFVSFSLTETHFTPSFSVMPGPLTVAAAFGEPKKRIRRRRGTKSDNSLRSLTRRTKSRNSR